MVGANLSYKLLKKEKYCELFRVGLFFSKYFICHTIKNSCRLIMRIYALCTGTILNLVA